MKLLRALISNLVFSLNVLLIFLVIFRDRLDVPVWLQPVGRMHPLLLHLPIGFLMLSIIMVLFRSGFKKKSFHNFLNFVFYFSALTAVVTAIMGLLLSQEGGYDESQLNLHLYTGVGVSALSAWLLYLSLYAFKKTRIFTVSLAVSALVLVAAGHFGSVLTHGENFILQPLVHDEEEEITDSTSLYAAVIHPVLKTKCMSCHNDKKMKGGLSMASADKIMKGGEHGAAWVAGDPDKSNLIKRIHLPEENDDHMPPAGKTQLSTVEMEILYRWVKSGADFLTPWTKFQQHDSLRILADQFIRQRKKSATVHYSFPSASAETVQKLNTPYCTVTQLASDEPALKADFFLSQSFDPHTLEELLKVKEQLVALNLSRMPVTDADGKVIGQFKNLKRLNLNQTGITGNILLSLKELSHLKSISLAGTSVDKKSLETLAVSPSLKEVFLWNTRILPDEKLALQKQFPLITWDQGYRSAEILKLTPPLLVNESLLLIGTAPITLKHNLPGTQIRYTLDGSDPDSVSGTVYAGPIAITKYSLLKTRAYKEGWYGSPQTQFYFFKEGVKPVSAELLNPPDKDYKGEGAATLTDSKKGAADNFKDIAWLGFRDQPLVAKFVLKQGSTVNTVTLSYSESFPAYVFPPASVELWAGNDFNHLKLIQRIVPIQPSESGPREVKGIVFKVPQPPGTHFKIKADPIAKVPKWITKKAEKGWVFVDEVIFN